MNRRLFCLLSVLLTWCFGREAVADTALPWCHYDDPAVIFTAIREGNTDHSDPTKNLCQEMDSGNIDPHSRPKELVLPMPCGRRMVFERIDFPNLEHSLDHVVAFLGSVQEIERPDGSNNAIQAVSSGPWKDSVSGGFSEASGDRGTRSLYLGKYEVTVSQFALMRRGLLEPGVASERADDPACAEYQAEIGKIRAPKVLPAVDMSWHDAVTFGYAYTNWLLNIDRERVKQKKLPYLPWQESAPGFFRLPTEAEWEYAARGGIVERQNLDNRVYMVPDQAGRPTTPSIEDIAFISTVQKPPPSGSNVDYVGRRLPNAYGLYDMLGNAEEIVYDLFRPTRPDGLTGQRGGYVVRGGDANLSEDLIGVGYRREVPFFDGDGPTSSALAGFRLLLSAPVFINLGDWRTKAIGGAEQAQSMAEALRILRERDGGGAPSGQDEAIVMVETLRRAPAVESGDVRLAALKSELAAIQITLEESRTQLNERQREVERQQFRSAVLTFSNINVTYRRIDVASSLVENLHDDIEVMEMRGGADARKSIREMEELIAEAHHSIATMHLWINANFEHYVGLIYALAAAGPKAATAAAAAVGGDFAAKGMTEYLTFQGRVHAHIEEAIEAGGALATSRLERWQNEMREI